MNKKLLVFGGVFLLVIIAVFSLFLQFSPTSQKANTVNNNATQNSSNSVSNSNILSPSISSGVSPSIAIIPSTVPADWQTFSGNVYTLKYPPNWNIQDKSLTGYKIIKFSPIQNGYYDPIAPSVTIETIINSTESLKQREFIETSNQTPTTRLSYIDGSKADLVSSQFPAPTINGQSYGTVQYNIYYVQKGANQLIIQVQYSTFSDRQLDKNNVQSIISSINLI